MPCFDGCRKNLYRYGFFDGETENKYCIGAGITSYVGALGCIGGTVAFFQTNLTSSALATVLAATASGLCIGSALALGSVCLSCGIEGCQELRTPVLPLRWPNRSTEWESINPLERISPPHQPQMPDVAPNEHRQPPSSSINPQLNPEPRAQRDQEQMFSSNSRFFHNSTLHSQTMNVARCAKTREHNDEFPLARRNSFSSVNPSDITKPFQRERSLSAPL